MQAQQPDSRSSEKPAADQDPGPAHVARAEERRDREEACAADDILGLNELLLRAVGLWPLDEPGRRGPALTLRRLYLAWTGVASALTLLFAILTVVDVYTSWDSGAILVNVQGASDASVCVLLAYKYHMMLRHRRTAAWLVRSLRHGFSEFQAPVHEYAATVVGSSHRMSRSITRLYLAMSSNVIVTLVGMHFAQNLRSCDALSAREICRERRAIVVRVWFPLDIGASPTWEAVTLLFFVDLAVVCVLTSSFDTMFLSVTLHLGALLRVLERRMTTAAERMRELAARGRTARVVLSAETACWGDAAPTGEVCRLLDGEVRKCMEMHQLILKFGETFDGTYSSCMLAQLAVSLLGICFQAFRSAVMELTFMRVSYMLLYFLWMLAQLWLVCWCGEHIAERSESVSKAAYGIDWVGTPERLQTSLLLMMRRAQKPLPLTAHKFGRLSYALFVLVVKNAYSFWNVLWKMNK